MERIYRIADWLETHWVTPAYSGWLLGGIAICFFGAATNTMAGWLYVISGIIFALLGLGAFLPARSLRHLSIHRRPIAPVTVGDKLTVEIDIENPTPKAKTLLQIQDVLQSQLGKPIQTTVETIEPHSFYHWVYFHNTQKRGVYRWYEVQMRTGTPLGLFWCRRSRQSPATAIVYPTVLPLNCCPLVDEMGREDSPQIYSNRRSNSATEDLTRSLRNYRVGDPIRLIHWRTSARYGELLVRELEVFTGSQDIIIALDSSNHWHWENFELAVIAAASMYFYAGSRKLGVKLWTGKTGLLHGERVVLEALAATNAAEDNDGGKPPYLPLIWLTENPVSVHTLPPGSRWVLWLSNPGESIGNTVAQDRGGIIIDSTEPLQRQLQLPLINK
ncbi:MAG TPA: DUF58 domain-containing protein [Cyanobacteria bacterium UBA11149]|nr:DUF58 domain-containing protein [Cyanobacteria bacterium UBA11367]HBE58108.1 DUF58 domain-containing protein [Cyanobacteria bacterium UBA11366]HBK64177.1 DUF58 domain-containing protein [Cyanobacteria bacterium UBA11166]HBR77175.1 DUF58 domain-containing protein [Cyanobacteria bacterium UBA11159]HBS71228.1 DUF58 domain-containing protein [Cyanobacteria bacterium UBA11153]HBW88121.1 DUF58 domain-containing protein [Cyanobacteria bacterium UBA11149]HCA95854.1 DUF58 domain-containing protein 